MHRFHFNAHHEIITSISTKAHAVMIKRSDVSHNYDSFNRFLQPIESVSSLCCVSGRVHNDSTAQAQPAAMPINAYGELSMRIGAKTAPRCPANDPQLTPAMRQDDGKHSAAKT
mmetsp:Transcript_13149/g.23647  ORF Transcript_13149/g.23647 Transcript_13149/m.23647 type:complete len:114 (+) Transcript_13149:4149-4490(+)